jgi:hypothetical protein
VIVSCVTCATDGAEAAALLHPLSVDMASESPRSSAPERRMLRVRPAPDTVIAGLRSYLPAACARSQKE